VVVVVVVVVLLLLLLLHSEWGQQGASCVIMHRPRMWGLR
jgi:hypothetical protein